MTTKKTTAKANLQLAADKVADKRVDAIKTNAMEFLKANYSPTDIEVKVSRNEIAATLAKRDKDIVEIAQGDDKALNEQVLKTLYEAIAEHFTTLGFREVAVVLRHHERYELQEQQKRLAAQKETATLSQLVESAVRKVLQDEGIVEKRDNA